MDAEQEPIGIYPRRVCVGFAFYAASEARSEQISSFYIKTAYLTGISRQAGFLCFDSGDSEADTKPQCTGTSAIAACTIGATMSNTLLVQQIFHFAINLRELIQPVRQAPVHAE